MATPTIASLLQELLDHFNTDSGSGEAPDLSEYLKKVEAAQTYATAQSLSNEVSTIQDTLDQFDDAITSLQNAGYLTEEQADQLYAAKGSGTTPPTAPQISLPRPVFCAAYSDNVQKDTGNDIRAEARNAYVVVDLIGTTPEIVQGFQDLGNKVAAYMSIGTGEDWRDDFAQLQPYLVTTQWGDWPGEYFVDRVDTGIVSVMKARLETISAMGFDFVEFDNMDWAEYDNSRQQYGFQVTVQQAQDYYNELALYAKSLGLEVMAKNTVLAAMDNFFGVVYESTSGSGENWWDTAGAQSFVDAGKLVVIVHYADPDPNAAYQRYIDRYGPTVSFIAENMNSNAYQHFNTDAGPWYTGQVSSGLTKEQADALYAAKDALTALAQRVTNIEASGGSGEPVDLSDYYTKQQADDKFAPKGSGGGSTDLSNYWTKTETQAAITSALGSGPVSDSDEHGLRASRFGLKFDGSDETNALEDFWNESAVRGIPAVLPMGATVRTRGMKAQARGGQLKSLAETIGWRTSAPKIQFIGTPKYVDKYGRSIAIALNMPGEDRSYQDDQHLKGLWITDPDKRYDIGVYGHYGMAINIDHMTSLGFGTPFLLARMWYSEFGSFSIWQPRKYGFSIYDPLLRNDGSAAQGGANQPADRVQKHNGVNLKYAQVNNNSSGCDACFDFRAAFAFHAGTLTAENKQRSSFLVSPRTNGLVIDMIHTEGAAHTFEIDDVTGGSYAGGAISVLGGYIDTAKTGNRLLYGAGSNRLDSLDLGSTNVNHRGVNDYYDLGNKTRIFRNLGMIRGGDSGSRYSNYGLGFGIDGNQDNPQRIG